MRVLGALRNRFKRHSPLALTHSVTSLCNARCKTCDEWKKSSGYRNDLSKREIFGMLGEAERAGILSYITWGGEPLLRGDLHEILKRAQRHFFVTGVITNGYLLKERFRKIAPFTDHLIVSIDADDRLHDEMRGVGGMLDRAIEGIRLCKQKGMNVIINSVISSLNLDRIDGLLRLSTELDVPIAFEPMDVNEGYNEQYVPSGNELRAAFSKIIRYKKSGYRVANSFRYLRNFSAKKRYVCHAPKCYVMVDAHGNITSCFRKIWGNVKDTSFERVFGGGDFRAFCKEAEACNKCNVSCVIESSLAYSPNPARLLGIMSNLYFM